MCSTASKAATSKSWFQFLLNFFCHFPVLNLLLGNCLNILSTWSISFSHGSFGRMCCIVEYALCSLVGCQHFNPLPAVLDTIGSKQSFKLERLELSTQNTKCSSISFSYLSSFAQYLDLTCLIFPCIRDRMSLLVKTKHRTSTI